MYKGGCAANTTEIRQHKDENRLLSLVSSTTVRSRITQLTETGNMKVSMDGGRTANNTEFNPFADMVLMEL